MRVGYLGPAGHGQPRGAAGAPGADVELVPLPTLHAAVLAVHDGDVDRALVPIENSLEGAVNPTLDALAFETDDVTIVGELLHPVHLPVRRGAAGTRSGAHRDLAPAGDRPVRALPAPSAAGRAGAAAPSTADAVRQVADGVRVRGARSARGSPASSTAASCCADGIEDDPGNETRFVWLAPAGTEPAAGDRSRPRWCSGAPDRRARAGSCAAWRSSRRAASTSRGSSRDRSARASGDYMFFLDFEGVRDAGGRRRGRRAAQHADVVRVLGSFPAAA